eukprot:Rhum_TRINITY_DN10969_c0_g1::Rhum_TRINITY_DN10969_c0_g1_i1::g.41560::m.41560
MHRVVVRVGVVAGLDHRQPVDQLLLRDVELAHESVLVEKSITGNEKRPAARLVGQAVVRVPTRHLPLQRKHVEVPLVHRRHQLPDPLPLRVRQRLRHLGELRLGVRPDNGAELLLGGAVLGCLVVLALPEGVPLRLDDPEQLLVDVPAVRDLRDAERHRRRKRVAHAGDDALLHVSAPLAQLLLEACSLDELLLVLLLAGGGAQLVQDQQLLLLHLRVLRLRPPRLQLLQLRVDVLVALQRLQLHERAAHPPHERQRHLRVLLQLQLLAREVHVRHRRDRVVRLQRHLARQRRRRRQLVLHVAGHRRRVAAQPLEVLLSGPRRVHAVPRRRGHHQLPAVAVRQRGKEGPPVLADGEEAGADAQRLAERGVDGVLRLRLARRLRLRQPELPVLDSVREKRPDGGTHGLYRLQQRQDHDVEEVHLPAWEVLRVPRPVRRPGAGRDEAAGTRAARHLGVALRVELVDELAQAGRVLLVDARPRGDVRAAEQHREHDTHVVLARVVVEAETLLVLGHLLDDVEHLGVGTHEENLTHRVADILHLVLVQVLEEVAVAVLQLLERHREPALLRHVLVVVQVRHEVLRLDQVVVVHARVPHVHDACTHDQRKQVLHRQVHRASLPVPELPKPQRVDEGMHVQHALQRPVGVVEGVVAARRLHARPEAAELRRIYVEVLDEVVVAAQRPGHVCQTRPVHLGRVVVPVAPLGHVELLRLLVVRRLLRAVQDVQVGDSVGLQHVEVPDHLADLVVQEVDRVHALLRRRAQVLQLALEHVRVELRRDHVALRARDLHLLLLLCLVVAGFVLLHVRAVVVREREEHEVEHAGEVLRLLLQLERDRRVLRLLRLSQGELDPRLVGELEVVLRQRQREAPPERGGGELVDGLAALTLEHEQLVVGERGGRNVARLVAPRRDGEPRQRVLQVAVHSHQVMSPVPARLLEQGTRKVLLPPLRHLVRRRGGGSRRHGVVPVGLALPDGAGRAGPGSGSSRDVVAHRLRRPGLCVEGRGGRAIPTLLPTLLRVVADLGLWVGTAAAAHCGTEGVWESRRAVFFLRVLKQLVRLEGGGVGFVCGS